MVDTATVIVPIETKHGDGCTCRPVGEIHLDLVAASRSCPGDRNPHRAGSLTQQLAEHGPTPYPGRVIIVWPGTDPKQWQTAFRDAGTGQLLPTAAFSLVVDWGDGGATPNDPITIDLHLLVDGDGQPLLGEHAKPVPDPNGRHKVRSALFRCLVAEMRIREDNAK